MLSLSALGRLGGGAVAVGDGARGLQDAPGCFLDVLEAVWAEEDPSVPPATGYTDVDTDVSA